MGVCSCASGGGGDAELDKVSAWWGNIIVGVMVFSVDINVGIDQVVGLGIEGTSEMVLALLDVGVQVGVMSGRGQQGGGGGWANSEVVDEFLEGGVGCSHGDLCLSEELLFPLKGNCPIRVGKVVCYRVAMVDEGFQVVGEGSDGGPFHFPALGHTAICRAFGPEACEGIDTVLVAIDEVE